MLQERDSYRASPPLMSPAGHAVPPATSGAARVGAELHTARQRLGWDLPAVAAGLRIRLAYLEALECGRIGDLPGNAYALGFLRTYAQSLGLDPDEMTRRFRAEATEMNQKTELDFPVPVPQRGVPAGAVVLLGVLLAAGAYVGWYQISGREQRMAEPVPAIPERLAPLAGGTTPRPPPSPQVASVLPTTGADEPPLPVQPETMPQVSPSQAAAAPVPVPLPAPFSAPPPVAAPVPAPADGGRMVVLAKSDAWVKVRDKADNSVLLNRVLHAGDSWAVPAGRPQLLLTTGNAGGTELVVDGAVSPPLGNPGAVRHDLPLDPDLIKAGRLPGQLAAVPGAAPPSSAPPMPGAPASTPRPVSQ